MEELYDEERALPEARLYKRNLIFSLGDMLKYFKYYRMGGNDIEYNLKMACSEMMHIYDFLEPKIIRMSEKKTQFKPLLELRKYTTNIETLTRLDLKEIIKYKSLIVFFIEEMGITKIEISEPDPSRAVLDGLFS